jgi:hypothetical protein
MESEGLTGQVHIAPFGTRAKGRSRPSAVGCVALGVLGISQALGAGQVPGDPPACQTVRLSDIGWMDVTATPAVFSALLQQLPRQDGPSDDPFQRGQRRAEE